MKASGPFHYLTWKGWEQAIGPLPGFELSWYQKLLKHPQIRPVQPVRIGALTCST
jgi:hypothetical protein